MTNLISWKFGLSRHSRANHSRFQLSRSSTNSRDSTYFQWNRLSRTRNTFQWSNTRIVFTDRLSKESDSCRPSERRSQYLCKQHLWHYCTSPIKNRYPWRETPGATTSAFGRIRRWKQSEPNYIFWLLLLSKCRKKSCWSHLCISPRNTFGICPSTRSKTS